MTINPSLQRSEVKQQILHPKLLSAKAPAQADDLGSIQEPDFHPGINLDCRVAFAPRNDKLKPVPITPRALLLYWFALCKI